MPISYDTQLVFLSVIVAYIGCYVALHLIVRMAQAEAACGHVPNLCGATFALGTGFWCMHNFGVLALGLPVSLAFSIPGTLLSLAVLLVECAVALYILSRSPFSRIRQVCTGLLLATGVASMHFTGMQSLQLDPAVGHAAPMAVLAIGVAALCLCASLRLVFPGPDEARPSVRNTAVAVGMMTVGGVALHYLGMQAVQISANAVHSHSLAELSGAWLAGISAAGACVLLAVALILFMSDARAVGSGIERRITTLAALGFSLLLMLGVGTSVYLGYTLQQRIEEARALQQLIRQTRVSVQSAQLDYMLMAQEVAGLLLDPNPAQTFDERYQRKLQAENNANMHLANALSATGSAELRKSINNLYIIGWTMTKRIEDEVMHAAVTDFERARRLYQQVYLPAQRENLLYLQDAFERANAEVNAFTENSNRSSRLGQRLALFAIIALCTIGLFTALLIGRAIRSLAHSAQDSAQKNRDLMEQSLEVICSIDEEGRFSQINPACERMWGFTPEELLGRSFLNFVSSDDVAATRAATKAIQAGNAVSGFHARCRHKNGAMLHMMWSARWSPGQRQMFCVVHDVTASKRAEEALRASEERTRLIIASAYDAFVGINESGAVTDWNPQAEQLFGWSSKEAIGQPLHLLIIPEPYRERHLQALQRFLNDGHSSFLCRRIELPGLDRSGCRLLLEITISPIKINGSYLFGAFMRDITERKRIEAELHQAKEAAEHATRAKSAFLATMSHEIRTPMNGVMGMVEVLAHSKLSASQMEVIDTIRDSASLLLGIVDDILDFSKIEAGRLELAQAPVQLAELAEGICTTMLPVANRNNVFLSLFISPQLPAWVVSDDCRLSQILYNLIGNAIKFSSFEPQRAGRVSLRIECVHTQPLRVTFSIADNGIGIAPDVLSRLFTPFSQAEVSTTRRFGGTGLGLAICKRLIDLMGGDIGVDSQPGKGTVFTVSLPFETVDGPRRPSANCADLRAVILANGRIEASDIRCYLEHAGMSVQVMQETEYPAAVSWSATGQLLLIREARHVEGADVALPTEPGKSHLHSLSIALVTAEAGDHSAAPRRIISASALRRSALLSAVAEVAGRLTMLPEPAALLQAPLDSLDKPGYRMQTLPRLTWPGPTWPGPTWPGPVSCDTGAPLPDSNRRILVAEDDQVNQKVLLAQLRLLGYTAQVAGNGIEALNLWRDCDYALLLSDLHMPEMDGYTLARSIRAEESGRRRIPILALTANALRGEAIHAHEAGMDDYLTKPLQLSALQSALEKWLPEESAQSGGPQPSVRQERSRSFDVQYMRQILGIDEFECCELLSEFRQTVKRQKERLQSALDACDPAEVAEIVHQLKSSSQSVGALALTETCKSIEAACRTQRHLPSPEMVAQFELLLEEADEEMAAFIALKGYSTYESPHENCIGR